MSNSYVEYTGDNAQTVFSYASIQMFDDDFVSDASQLRVYIDKVLKVVNVDWTANASTKQVTFASPPYTNAVIRIQRFTKSDSRYVNYTDSTNITATILNTDSTQNFFLAQEAKDLESDAMLVGSDGKWDSRGRGIGSVAPAVFSTDAVNLGQLSAAINGTLPTNLGNWGYVQYTGTGAQTLFAQPQETDILDANDLHVFVNGSKVIPVTDYTVDGENITFTSAPSNGHVIQVLWAKGTVGGLILEGTLTTPMLEDRAVTVGKMNSESATTGHVLKATGSGNCAFGTIVSNIITDFDTQVRTSRLTEMALPNTSLNVNGNKVINVSTPTLANDAVNKSYVDAINTTLQNADSANYTTLNNRITSEVASLTGYIDNQTLLQQQVYGTANTQVASNQHRIYFTFDQLYRVRTINLMLSFSTTAGNWTNAMYVPITIPVDEAAPYTFNGSWVGVGNDTTASFKPYRFTVHDVNTTQWISGTAYGNKYELVYNRYGTDMNEFVIGVRRVNVMGNSATNHLVELTNAHYAIGLGELL